MGALAGCGNPPRAGNVLLQAAVEASAAVQEFDYTISLADVREREGHRVLPEPSSSFSTLITHVPVGEGYDAVLTATSADHKTTCQGTAEFDVKTNATTVVRLTLACMNAGDGQVHVVVSVDCPQFRITSFTVSPLMASVGRKIAVAASASDTDGDLVTYSWSAPAGSFDDASSMQTTYTCTAPGAVPLTVAAQWGACRTSKMVSVRCLLPDAGVD